MKKTVFLLFLLGLPLLPVYPQDIAPYLPAQEKKSFAKNAPITVQYPYEDMRVPRGAKQIFIFGQVNLPQPATLDINGQQVPLHTNGGFVAFVPVQSGLFTFTLTATSGGQTVQALRHVRVPGTDIKDYAATASFDKEEAFPQHAISLLPGDTANLYVRGTPGARVTAQLPKFKNGKEIVLKEDASRPGTYRAAFVIDPDQKPKSSKVIYKMTDGPDHSKAKLTAPAKITVRGAQDSVRYAQVIKPGVKVRKLPTASGNLYPDYRAYGMLRLNGEMGGQYRVWLNGQEFAWLEKKHLKDVSNFQETPNILSFIRTDTTDARTRFIFTLGRAVPIKIHEYNDRLELTLYYVDGFEQNFSLDDTSPLVSNIQWSEPTEKTVAFRIWLRKGATLWGHAYNFEGNQLVLDIIHEPARAPAPPKQPLAGARIVLDAGHSPQRTVPYDGAIGPTGYLEYEANLALANELKPLLEQAGATVIMTREGNNKMSLQQRYQKALDEDAHLFISLHYNALPETINPLARPRGYCVYYNYPHSFALAEAVYKAFTRHVHLPDDGMISNDVLFIPRISQFPSILVENAYLILPEQEELARTTQGRAPFVQALYEGILNFYQPPQPPAAQKPARTKPRK